MYNGLDPVRPELTGLVVGNALPRILALINGKLASPPFSCALDGPVIVFAAIYHFAAAVAAMKDINQG